MKKIMPWVIAAAVTFTSFPAVSTLNAFADDLSEISSKSKSQALKNVENLKVYSSDTNSIEIHWKKVQNAKGYYVYSFNRISQKWEKITSVTSEKYTFSNLESGTSYTFAVRAFNDDNKSKSRTYIRTSTKPSEIKNFKISQTSTNGYKLTWSKVQGADKYYIYRYNSEQKKFNLLAKTKNNYLKVTKRKPAQKNLYKITAVKSVNGKIYSSNGIKKYAVTLPSAVKNLKVNVKKGTAQINWSKVNGADGYEIYCKKAGEQKYTLLKTIKSGKTTSCKTTSLAGKKVYIKVRSFVQVENKKYHGKFSKSVYKRIFNNKSYNQILKEYKNSFSITTSNTQGYKISSANYTELLNALTCLGGTESFALLDLDSGAMIGYNANSYIETASTVKMPFMLYSLKQMDKGKATLNTKMAYSYEDYNGGTGEVKYSYPGQLYTLREIFHKVCYLSDNSAYYMLQRKFGINGYNKYISSLGCRTSVSQYGNRWGYVSAADSAREWIQMYDYFKTGKYGRFIRNELANSGFSNFRIGLQGRNYKVYSKCGFTEYLHHDTAVVEAKHPYVLICLTTTVSAPRLQRVARAADNIHNEMWKYFNSK